MIVACGSDCVVVILGFDGGGKEATNEKRQVRISKFLGIFKAQTIYSSKPVKA
jgi:hypothetical protein